MSKTKAELEYELETLKKEHEEFIDKVRTVAQETAMQQGWCDAGVREAFEKLGIPSGRRVSGKVVVEINFSAECERSPEVVARDYASLAEFVRDSFIADIESLTIFDDDFTSTNVIACEVTKATTAEWE